MQLSWDITLELVYSKPSQSMKTLMTETESHDERLILQYEINFLIQSMKMWPGKWPSFCELDNIMQ